MQNACFVVVIVIERSVVSAAPVLPILEVSLAPPVDPLPVLSKQLGNVERRLEVSTQAGLVVVQKAYALALKEMHARIEQIVDRSWETVKEVTGPLSFLDARSEPGDVASVTLRVGDGPTLPPSISGQIASLGQALVQVQLSFFEEVAKSMSLVSDHIAQKLQVELEHQLDVAMGRGVTKVSAGFLAAPGFSRQLTVRPVASDAPYPSAASMVRDLLSRTSATENLAAVTALNLLSQLIEEINSMIAAKLQSVGRRI